MGTQPESPSALVFGPFEFDTVSGDLRKYGNRIRLQGKPLQILSLLLEQAGQSVSREDLQRQLWQDTTFVDFDQGLNSAVNKLRQALGDAADQPHYIETLPGRGYRFIAPIHRGSGRTVLEIAPPAAIREVRSHPRRVTPWMIGAAILTLVAAGASGFWLGARQERPAVPRQLVRFAVTPPPGFALEGAASRQSFALSPDGSRIAFTAMDASGDFSVFLRDLNSIEPRLITDSKGAHTLFWPPDGRSLFFTARGKIRRTQLNGDGQIVLGDTPPRLFSGIWINAGQLMLSTAPGSFTLPSSGGPLEPTAESYRWPHILPGGRYVLYVQWNPVTRRYRALTRPLAGGAPTFLLETDSRVQYAPSALDPNAGYLLYMRAGNLLAHPFNLRSLRTTGEAVPVAHKVYSFFPAGAAEFSVSAEGTLAYQSYASRSQLTWVDRGGQVVSRVGPSGVNVKSARLSPDGKQFATAIYDVERGMQNLWIFDTKSGAGRQLNLDRGLRDAALWGPNSDSIAYLNAPGGTSPRVVLSALGGNDAETPLSPGNFEMPLDWSPDGRFITYVNAGTARFAGDSQSDVAVIDMARNRKVVSLLNTPFYESNAMFSPDGKWLAFTSNESGDSQLYVQAFESGETPRVTGRRFLVSRAGAQIVRWRRDGKELYYLASDGRVHAVLVALSANPEFGPARALFTIGTEARAAIHSVPGFDVSPDGQRFLIPTVDTSIAAPALVVIQNWEAALRR